MFAFLIPFFSDPDPLRVLSKPVINIEICLDSFGERQQIKVPKGVVQPDGCIIVQESYIELSTEVFGRQFVPDVITIDMLWPQTTHNLLRVWVDRSAKKIVFIDSFKWHPARYPEDVYVKAIEWDQKNVKHVVTRQETVFPYEVTPLFKLVSLEQSVSEKDGGQVKIHLREFTTDEYFCQKETSAFAEQIRLGKVPIELKNISPKALEPDVHTHVNLTSWALRFSNLEAYRILLAQTPAAIFSDPLQGDLLIMSYAKDDVRFLQTTLNNIETLHRTPQTIWGTLPFWAVEEGRWDQLKMIIPVVDNLPEKLARRSVLSSCLSREQYENVNHLLDIGYGSWASKGFLSRNVYEELLVDLRDTSSERDRDSLLRLEKKMATQGARESFREFMFYLTGYIFSFDSSYGEKRFRIDERLLKKISTTGDVTPDQLALLNNMIPFFKDLDKDQKYIGGNEGTSAELKAADAAGEAAIGKLLFHRKQGQWQIDLSNL
jgi:hypothetical protein